MHTDSLTQLSESALQRARINFMLRHATVGALVGLLIATGFVLTQRWYPNLTTTTLTSWIPVVLILAGALTGWFRFRETSTHVAARLDELAQTAGTLSTWIALKTVPAASPMEEAFREAQRRDAVRRLERVKLAQHLPVRLPDWAAYGWLALLALCCAWLLPPREQSETLQSAGISYEVQPAGGGGMTPAGPEKANPLATQTKPQHLEISLLTPTDLLKADVMMQDAQTPMALKEDFLREMEAKMGGLALENMNPKERELLQALRRQTNAALAQEHPAETSATGPDGGTKPKENDTKILDRGLNALPKTEAERRAVFQERFPDVQTALEKYYKGIK